MPVCASCGTQIADGATCPKCAAGAAPAAGGLTDNVAGLLAYITFIPAIIFLVMEPYNKRRFIRFHAFQCLFFTVAVIVLDIVMMFLGHIPVIGAILSLLISLGIFVIWIILLIKAYQGQMFKLPVIGDMAEQQAGK
jgi:uncharacterized membrane protein